VSAPALKRINEEFGLNDESIRLKRWRMGENFLFKDLGVKPVEERDRVENDQNPDENGQRFIQPFEKRGAVFFRPVHPGEKIDHR
jgi:hypothetical protein